jgi:hypothetical protein
VVDPEIVGGGVAVADAVVGRPLPRLIQPMFGAVHVAQPLEIADHRAVGDIAAALIQPTFAP